MCDKNRRLAYWITFIAILAVEVCIALFVHDDFVRPYVGDALVTVLLCCLSRAVLPKLHPALPVFGISLAAELWQWLGLTKKLGLDGTVLGVILGATADWKDIVCYGIGCLLFSLTEYLLKCAAKR
jgi:hypothetical protein